MVGQVFDLADTVGGGNGTLPGTGLAFSYPTNGASLFLTQPTNQFVDGIFVPLANGSTQINSSGGTFDFSELRHQPSDQRGPGQWGFSVESTIRPI